MEKLKGQVERSRFTEPKTPMKRLIETIVLGLLLIDPGGPSRHPAFAQDRDYVTEGDGVLDPKHGYFFLKKKPKSLAKQ